MRLKQSPFLNVLPCLAWVHAALLILPVARAVDVEGDAAQRAALQGSTGVTLVTSDTGLKKLFDEAEAQAKRNFTTACGMRIMVEGGGYGAMWIETQPMAGEMYAKRDLEIALNNQLVFFKTQREDGRLPGMVTWGNEFKPEYGWMQGYCFPQPALEVYYLLGKPRPFLEALYKTLAGHDAWLWKSRDSDHNGILESWGEFDTVDDNNVLYAPGNLFFFAGETPPGPKAYPVPIQSMSVMGYSYSGRATLAEVSKALKNGEENEWKAKAEAVRATFIQKQWDPQRHAAFDRDRDDKVIDILLHHNLRCMYWGLFTQEMADQFIRYHLLNPREFWTPIPLPSIAVSDPKFYNHEPNDWSGPPQGLTYQRAIRALENYGHYAEITLLGRIYTGYYEKEPVFVAQCDPFNGQKSLANQGYGPAILAVLEYISRLYGVHIQKETVNWGGLERPGQAITYTQKWNGREYTLCNSNGVFSGYLNGKKLFTATAGQRVVTDLDGQVQKVIGIDTVPHTVALQVAGRKCSARIRPNEVYEYSVAKGKLLASSTAPFDYPFPDTIRNLALYKPVSAGSSLDQTNGNCVLHRAYLTDGLTRGYGTQGYSSGTNQPAGSPEWVEVDLGEDVKVDRVVLFPRVDPQKSGAASTGFPVDFTIQLRPSQGASAIVYRATGYPNPNGQAQTFDFKRVKARFVRVEATKLATGADGLPRLQLGELEVYDTRRR